MQKLKCSSSTPHIPTHPQYLKQEDAALAVAPEEVRHHLQAPVPPLAVCFRDADDTVQGYLAFMSMLMVLRTRCSVGIQQRGVCQREIPFLPLRVEKRSLLLLELVEPSLT